MEFNLTLAPTRFLDDPPERDDYRVFWTSEPFGRQNVGRIRQAVERTHQTPCGVSLGFVEGCQTYRCTMTGSVMAD